jgi:hypothetical protein
MKDDARPFRAQTVEGAPPSPYSPDISPSDFSLFGRVKGVLTGQEIPDEVDLLEALTKIFNDISDDELQRVFRSWIGRVQKVIDADGDYLASSIF